MKAFNTIFGHVLAKGGRLDAFIAADDAEAKARVSTFLESLGLRPLDVGGLHMAQTLEALGLMMIGLAKNGAGTLGHRLERRYRLNHRHHGLTGRSTTHPLWIGRDPNKANGRHFK